MLIEFDDLQCAAVGESDDNRIDEDVVDVDELGDVDDVVDGDDGAPGTGTGTLRPKIGCCCC